MLNQKGIGILEVLVALLLLSIAVLGFSAMQMRAIQATDETLIRSDAMVIIRNISEDMRLYPSKEQKQAYIDAIDSQQTTFSVDCSTSPCNEEQQLEYNAAQALMLAQASSIQIGAHWCADTQGNDFEKMCLITSWGETEPNRDGFENSCLNSEGNYIPGASCIVMETY